MPLGALDIESSATTRLYTTRVFRCRQWRAFCQLCAPHCRAAYFSQLIASVGYIIFVADASQYSPRS